MSESPVTVQVSLLQQLQRLLPPQPRPHKPPRPHRIRMQLLRMLQLVQQRRQPCHHHHLLLLLLLQAALLITMYVDLITLARMVCAAVSGDIAAPLKIIAVNAARVTVVDNLHHHLALLHLVQLLLQTILHHLLDSTTVPIMEKILGSLHTLGIGKLVLPMSKSMLTLTS